MKLIKYALLFFTAVIINAQQVNPIPEPKIEFNPNHYVCYRTDKPIKVDGKLNESIWQKAEWTSYFVDIEGNSKPAPRFKTRAKMLWDDNYLYIAAELEEPHVWANIKERDAVIFYDNDFEVFIDPDGDTHKYFELEINTFATAWDLLLVKPYRDDTDVAINSWDIRGLKTAVMVNGTINNPNDTDNGWSCEIAIPWKVLKESYVNQSTPKAGEIWRINFSRVEWKTEISGGKYIKSKDPQTGKQYPEDNWVWSPQGVINMHYPEMWGFLLLSGKSAGSGKEEFVLSSREKAKWALRKVYYAENAFKREYNIYTGAVRDLKLENYKVEGYSWPPEIEASKSFFKAVLKSVDGKDSVSIDNYGKAN